MKHIHSKEAMMLTKYPKELNPNWIIKQSTLGGRGLFAAKPIKKGTLILSNKPLVVAPRADCSGETYCSRCYKISDSCYPCDQCFSIICCEECQKSQEHKTECKFIKNNWKRKPNYDTYSDVLKLVQVYLRFLLLNEQQKDLLMELQRCIFKSNLKELELLCLKYIIPDDHLLFMEFVHSIMKLNSFRIAYNVNIKKIPLRGLYPLSSLLNHSCLPNTRSVFKEDHTMEVYAAKNIDIGEEIFTCYTGILWCTPARRCQLYITKDFWCNCRRCEDSTEMGTNLSALKCYTKECVGVLLPKTSLDPNGVWFCDNCHSEVPATKISTVQSVLGSLVGSLDLDDQFRLDAPIIARLASFVPCTNHIFIDIRLRLALRLGFSEALKLNELSESHLALKESLCRGSLRTLAALGVGDAHLRGLLLYHLHAALAERARRATHLYEELKAEIESTIEQAYNILQGDISAPPDLELRRRYLGPGCDKPQEERFFILDI